MMERNPIIYKDIEQHSDEWFELRHRCLLTASEFKDIITEKTQKVSSAKTLEAVAKKKAILHQKSYKEVESINEIEGNLPFKNGHMKRGSTLEDEAKKLYEAHYSTQIINVGFVLSTCKQFGYSPDGLIRDDGLIEVKSPAYVKHVALILDGEVPTEYYAQLQGGLMITGRKWIDLVCYNEFAPPFFVRVERDEEYINTLQNGLLQLSKHYQWYTQKLQKTFNQN